MMLNIRNLNIKFYDRQEPFTAVQNFNFQMDAGEIVGIVGESGSGKSMTCHAIMGLLRRKGVEITGTAEFDGKDLLAMSDTELREYQGEELSIIFQEPMTSLNPTMKIGKQVEESLRIHTKLSKAERKARALEAMELAELNDPQRIYNTGISASAFSSVMSQYLEDKEQKDFEISPNVVEREYCTHSGKLAASTCKDTKTGYYSVYDLPPTCSSHAGPNIGKGEEETTAPTDSTEEVTIPSFTITVEDVTYPEGGETEETTYPRENN